MYLDALPVLADANGRIHTTFNQVGTATAPLVIDELRTCKNIPDSDCCRAGDSCGVHCVGGQSADVCRLLAEIELRLMAHFRHKTLWLLDAYRTGKDIQQR